MQEDFWGTVGRELLGELPGLVSEFMPGEASVGSVGALPDVSAFFGGGDVSAFYPGQGETTDEPLANELVSTPVFPENCRELAASRGKLFGRTRAPLRDEYGRRLYRRHRQVGLSYEEKIALGLNKQFAGKVPLYIRTSCLSSTPPRRNWNTRAKRRNALKTLRAMARDCAVTVRASRLMNRLGAIRQRIGGGVRRAVGCGCTVKKIPCKVR